MSQASNSNNESRLSSPPLSTDPGDRGSVWKPTKATKAPIPPLVQRL